MKQDKAGGHTATGLGIAKDTPAARWLKQNYERFVLRIISQLKVTSIKSYLIIELA